MRSERQASTLHIPSCDPIGTMEGPLCTRARLRKRAEHDDAKRSRCVTRQLVEFFVPVENLALHTWQLATGAWAGSPV